MPALEKASLLAVMDKSDAPIAKAKKFYVQFNPASLHFTLHSVRDRGKTPARQDEQHLGSGNVTVTMDLHFDTADDGSDVRAKTAQVARFMRPAPHSSKPPPRVKFSWGDLVVVGVMASYQEDLALFSAHGTPLRAKVSISISAQDPGLAANETAAGSKTGDGATPPGAVGGAPGTVGFGASLAVGASASLGVSAGLGVGAGASLGVGGTVGDMTGIAIGGESAAEFTARVGADPSAWRGVAAGLDSTISLDAGVEIDFSSNLTANTGVGSAIGLETSASATIEEAVGLAGEAATPVRSGAAPGTASGLALAAAGGVQAAVATAQVAIASSAASGAMEAYGLPATTTPALAVAEALVPPAALQPRPPLRSGDLPVAAAQTPARSVPAPRQADSRATTFGDGVPLRPLVSGAAESRSGAIGGLVTLDIRERPAVTAPVTVDPTQAPWAALAAGDPGRSAADRAQARIRPLCSCGCATRSPCSCGSGRGSR